MSLRTVFLRLVEHCKLTHSLRQLALRDTHYACRTGFHGESTFMNRKMKILTAPVVNVGRFYAKLRRSRKNGGSFRAAPVLSFNSCRCSLSYMALLLRPEVFQRHLSPDSLNPQGPIRSFNGVSMFLELQSASSGHRKKAHKP